MDLLESLRGPFLVEREQGPPRHDLDREPDRGFRTAVIGAGPAGLLAAHDLGKRGYRVDLLDAAPEPGGCLLGRIPSFRLPREVVRRDLTVLERLGVRVQCGSAVAGTLGIAELRRRYQAVLVATGFAGAEATLAAGGGLRRTARGTVWADPVTCETGVEGVFDGHGAERRRIRPPLPPGHGSTQGSPSAGG